MDLDERERDGSSAVSTTRPWTRAAGASTTRWSWFLRGAPKDRTLVDDAARLEEEEARNVPRRVIDTKATVLVGRRERVVLDGRQSRRTR